MATFGKTSVGDTGGNQWGNNKIACLFNLPEAANVTSISLYQRDYLEVGGEPIIYGMYDLANNFKGATQAGVTTSGDVWLTLNYTSPLNLPVAGDYWLSALFSARTEFWYSAGVANQWKTNSDTYTDGFSDPFGSSDSTNAWEMSIYATYTPAPLAEAPTPKFKKWDSWWYDHLRQAAKPVVPFADRFPKFVPRSF